MAECYLYTLALVYAVDNIRMENLYEIDLGCFSESDTRDEMAE